MAGKERTRELVRVTGRGVVSLPKELRGDVDLYEVFKRDDGVIELHPKVTIDHAQAWFWSRRWQQMEREAQADIEAGRVHRYDSDEAMFSDLDAHRASRLKGVKSET